MNGELPHGWRFATAQPRPCPRCKGRGEIRGTQYMIAPTGRRTAVIGFSKQDAERYAEIWAPENCTPAHREELYGPA